MDRVTVTLTLDVYDHDVSEVSMKAIACDNTARRVRARFLKLGSAYDIGNDAVVFLTVVRPDGVGVSVRCATILFTGEYNGFGAEGGLSNAALEVKGTALGQFVIRNETEVIRSEIFKIEVGRALDQDTEEWAYSYQGYNLDDLVAKLDGINVSSIDEDGSKLIIQTANGGQMYHDYVDEKIYELRQEASTAVKITVSDAVYISTTGGT